MLALSQKPCDPLLFARVREEHQLQVKNTGFEAEEFCTYERCVRITASLDVAEGQSVRPENIARIDLRLHVLESRFHHADAKLACLSSTSAEQVTAYMARIFTGGIHVSAYIGGNLDRNEANKLFEAVMVTLRGESLKRCQIKLEHCMRLPQGAALWQVPPRNKADTKCAVEVYWQLG